MKKEETAMTAMPVIIDTREHTEGYQPCIVGDEPHSVRGDVAVPVHMRPGELLGAGSGPVSMCIACATGGLDEITEEQRRQLALCGHLDEGWCNEQHHSTYGEPCDGCQCHPDGSEIVYC